MTLEERITREFKKAIKLGDHIRMNTLRYLGASIIEFHESAINREINHDDKLKILHSAVKKRKYAIEFYPRANHLDIFEA